MAESGDYATRSTLMDCPAIGRPLPLIEETVMEEIEAVAQHARLAAGRLRIAAMLLPESQPGLQLLIDLLDSLAEYMQPQEEERRS